MCHQPTCVRALLLLVLGFLMLYDNQATPVEKRAQAAGDVDTKLIKNLKNTIDTLVESVDKLRRQSKQETEKLEEKVQQLNERLENKTEQINERLEYKTEQINERLENKTEQINERLENKAEQINERLEKKTEQINVRIVNEIVTNVSSKLGTMSKMLVLGFNPKFYVSGVYKGRIYLLSKEKKDIDIDREEGRCESFGGYLLELNDMDEARFVEVFVKSVVGSADIITGFNNIKRQRHFVHAKSGNTLKKSFWRKGEPNGDGHCTMLSSGTVRDTPCTWPKHFVCEIPN